MSSLLFNEEFPQYIEVEENESQIESLLKQESDVNEAMLVLEGDPPKVSSNGCCLQGNSLFEF